MCSHTGNLSRLLLCISVFKGPTNGKLQDPYLNFTLDAQLLDSQVRLAL